MFEIIKNKFSLDFDYDGIKIIQTKYPTKTYRDLMLNSNIQINGKSIKSDDVIYISELNKLSDFLNLSKKSKLMKEIIDLLDTYPIINHDNIRSIKESINKKYSEELLEDTCGDISKVINLFLEFINDNYLDSRLFEIFLNMFDESKLVILDNVSWINVDMLSKFLNEHNFIILTHDFRNYIKSIDMLELLLILKDNYDFTDIKDSKNFMFYLEKQLNIEINKEKLEELLRDKNSLDSIRFLSETLKI